MSSSPEPPAGPSTTADPTPPPPGIREPTPEPPPYPGGGYGLGVEEPKPLTIRPLYPPTDLESAGQHSITILRLITDSIAQQSKVLSRHVVLHPPLLRPFSDNLRVSKLPIPPIVAMFLAVGVWLFQRLYQAENSGLLDVGLRTMCYLAAAAFVYLTIVERIVAMYGGFTDRASSIAKSGLPTALGLSGPNDPALKGWVVEWGDDVVGVIAYKKQPAGRSPSTGKVERERIEIQAFTVKNIYRGQGLGTGLVEKVLDEELKFGQGGRKVDVTWAGDCINGYAFVPRWLRGGLDEQWERVSGKVKRMVEERERDWAGRDRGKKRE